LLDLYSGAGGAAVGYHRAGFEVVGVDNRPQPRYPFEFVQADALEYLAEHGNEYAAIHASPPCQDYTAMANYTGGNGTGWLLPATRDSLIELGLPCVVENVAGAPMRPDIVLCGCMVGLPAIRRQRWFEVSWPVAQLSPPCYHSIVPIPVIGHGVPSWWRQRHGRNPTIDEKRAAMGITWMNRDELSEAIPPAYTHFVGEMLLHHLYPPGAAVLPTKTAAAPGHHNSQGARFGTLRAPWGSVPNVP
jgi:DNA (cytosine-5)-methyltransferase 1